MKFMECPEAVVTDSVRGRGGWAFLAKGLLMVLLLGAPFFLLGEMVRMFVPWKAAQDRLNQIQWNTPQPQCGIVLLGDSVFNSQIGGDPPATVWNRLSFYSDIEVFPATFSGARPTDILSGARWLTQQDLARGSVVFLDIHPMRLMLPPGPRGGIYRKWAWVAVRPEWDPTLEGVERWITYTWTRPFFLLTHPPVWEAFLHGALKPAPADAPPNEGAVFWGDRTDNNFKNLKKSAQENETRLIPEYLQLYDRTQTVLREKGLRPVVVCTPFNRTLIEKYCAPEEAQALIALVDEARNRLIGHLDQKGFEYVDLTNALPSEAFADTIHPNAMGNDLLARAMFEWLVQHPDGE